MQNQVVAKQTTLNMTISIELSDKHLGHIVARVLGVNKNNMRVLALRQAFIMIEPP